MRRPWTAGMSPAVLYASRMNPRSPELADEEIMTRLAAIPQWSLRDAALFREFRFDGFAEAFGFMASVAIVAQEMDHHPDWTNVFDRVTIRLSSHDVRGISERDFALAARIDRLALARAD